MAGKTAKKAAFRRPPTAQEAVSAELRRSILEGELRPGSQILQDKVAEQFGVSRVPVREALKMLEGEGQISYAPHRGYFVTELDIGELIEAYSIRNILEAEAVRAAIPNLTPEDDERLEEALIDTEVANREDDLIALTAANRRFHFALIEPCGMPRLIRIVRQLWDSTDPYRSIYFVDPKHRKKVDREHRAILKAVSARDADRAIELLAGHRAGTVESLQHMLQKEDGPDGGSPAT
jgi:DNA-binding GntR family transcriptional regulator